MLFSNSLCLLCDRSLEQSFGWERLFSGEEPSPICSDCMEKLQYIEGETCSICHRPFTTLDEQYRQGGLCLDCIRWENDCNWCGLLQSNHSIYVYNEFLTEVLAKFKFRGDYELCSIFKKALQERLAVLDYDLIVPIPLSTERLYERGFNQVEALIETTMQPYARVLARNHTEKQSKKSRTDRIKQEQVFSFSNVVTVQGKNILLVDDIYTTGSTLRHAAKILKKHGAGVITSLTLARG